MTIAASASSSASRVHVTRPTSYGTGRSAAGGKRNSVHLNTTPPQDVGTGDAGSSNSRAPRGQHRASIRQKPGVERPGDERGERLYTKATFCTPLAPPERGGEPGEKQLTGRRIGLDTSNRASRPGEAEGEPGRGFAALAAAWASPPPASPKRVERVRSCKVRASEGGGSGCVLPPSRFASPLLSLQPLNGASARAGPRHPSAPPLLLARLRRAACGARPCPRHGRVPPPLAQAQPCSARYQRQPTGQA